MRARVIACLAVAGWLLAGCSLLRPKVETPRLSVVHVELMKSGLWEQQLRVRLRVQNPNDLVLPVKGIDYKLEVAGAEFAHGVSTASFSVPALGEAEFDMNVTANIAGTMLRLLNTRADQIDYRIAGTVSLSSGWVHAVPFDQRGTFPLK
jgi:LEA14-like dessication related protein